MRLPSVGDPPPPGGPTQAQVDAARADAVAASNTVTVRYAANLPPYEAGAARYALDLALYESCREAMNPIDQMACLSSLTTAYTNGMNEESCLNDCEIDIGIGNQALADGDAATALQDKYDNYVDARTQFATWATTDCALAEGAHAAVISALESAEAILALYN